MIWPFRKKLEERATGYGAAAFIESALPRISITADRAQGLSVATACVSTIATTLSGVPLVLYRRDADGARSRASDHPLYGVLHDMPNPHMTAFELREALISDVLVHGNAYALIEWDRQGRVTGLEWIPAREIQPERLPSGALRYRRQRAGTAPATVHSEDEILHIRHRIAPDGFTGVSPLAIARETVRTALTEQERAAEQAERAFQPHGLLEGPFPTGDAAERAAADVALAVSKSRATGRHLLAVPMGHKFNPTAFSPKDAEFLESRKLSDLAVCRIFNVPPSVVGIETTTSYRGLDSEQRALVAKCLAPMAKRIEAAMTAALLPPSTRAELYVEHDLSGLMRGDPEARANHYKAMREIGAMSANEIRRLENLPPYEGGDQFLKPMNHEAAGEAE